jgi:hypothetical protein
MKSFMNTLVMVGVVSGCTGETGALPSASVDSEQEVANALQQPLTSAPSSCAAVKAQKPTAGDGNYTLTVGLHYVTVYCAGMAGTTPTEYLNLPTTNENANTSKFGPIGNSAGVTTRFTKVRFNPNNLTIDTTDTTFSTSTGWKTFGSTTYYSNDYAHAGDCYADFSTTGTANVNLTGTPFSVKPNQFTKQGWNPAGTVAYSHNNQVVDLTGGGLCGAMALSSGSALQLAWNNAANQYMGCFADSEIRALPVLLGEGTYTVESCISAAKSSGYLYAGLQYSTQCFAGNSVGYNSVSDSECNFACSGDSTQKCGGSWRNSVYATGVQPANQYIQYVGCFTDSESRALPTLLGTSYTVESCVNAAKAAGYLYAGLQAGGQCFAGNSVGHTAVPNSQCDTPCGANPREMCGGSWRNSIYATGCPNGQTLAQASGMCTSCPSGQTLLPESGECVTLTPWDASPLLDGSRIAMRVSKRFKDPQGMLGVEDFGPAWVKVGALLEVSSSTLSENSIFTVNVIPRASNEYLSGNYPSNYQKLLIRGSNGGYMTVGDSGGDLAATQDHDNAGIMIMDLGRGTNAALYWTGYSYKLNEYLARDMARVYGTHFLRLNSATLWGVREAGLSAASNFELFIVH